MANRTAKNCIFCTNVIPPYSKCKSLASKPVGIELQFHQVVEFVLIHSSLLSEKFNKISPVKPIHYEDRFLCHDCALTTKNAYLNLKTLKDTLGVESYIRMHLLESGHASTQTSPILPQISSPTAGSNEVARQPKTPIGKKMQNAMKVKRCREILQNQVKLVVNREIKAFAVNSCLRSFAGTTGFVPSDAVIDSEIVSHCPTVYKILCGLFNRTTLNEDMKPSIRMALSMAAYAQSPYCNGMQKTVALILYKNKCPIKVCVTLPFHPNILYRRQLKVTFSCIHISFHP
jgi:hypothetical protein